MDTAKRDVGFIIKVCGNKTLLKRIEFARRRGRQPKSSHELAAKIRVRSGDLAVAGHARAKRIRCGGGGDLAT